MHHEAPPKWQLGLGTAYAIASVVAGWYFIYLVAESFGNDLWWAQYDVRSQACLIDIVNDHLKSTSSGTSDLVGSRVYRVYDREQSFTAVYPTHAHQLVYEQLISVQYGIASLRAMSPNDALIVKSQFCWVDFEMRWEIAHTEARQRRCRRRATNAALYFESVLRNIDYHLFLQSFGGPGNTFSVTLQQGLEESAAGAAFLSAIAAVKTTEMEEIAHWASFGLTSFQLQWHNRYQTGVSETLELKNALGLTATITLKDLPPLQGSWSSSVLYWQLINDLYQLQACNESLIRYNVSNSFVTGGCVPTFETFALLHDDDGSYSAQRLLVHESIGPFLSIDTFVDPVPATLLAFVHNFTIAVSAATASNAHLRKAFEGVASGVMYPTPPSWQNAGYQFHGGSPICIYGVAKSYVQAPFDTTTLCQSQLPFATPFSAFSLLLATASALLVAMPAAICALQTSANCSTMLASTAPVLAAMRPATSGIDASAFGNISIMQYATTVSGDWRLLYQPLATTDAWSFFGWLLLIDWAVGAREVVSFEGDVATARLISNSYAALEYSTSGSSLLESSSTVVIAYILLYTTLVFTAVLCLLGVAVAVRSSHVCPSNLWVFPRVTGSVWIGRPLLLLRGGTAIVILSTANLSLYQSEGWSAFVCAPRSLIDILILSSEASWVSYVLQDVLQLVVPKLTLRYATPSAVLVAAVHMCIEFMWPVQPLATLATTCRSAGLDTAVTCTRGTLAIGSTHRAALLVASHGLVTAFGIVTAAFLPLAAERTDASTPPYLLSGVAEIFLAPQAANGTDAVPNDPCACLIAGLVPVPSVQEAPTMRFFDLNRWVLVALIRDYQGPSSFSSSHSKIVCVTRHSFSMDKPPRRKSTQLPQLAPTTPWQRGWRRVCATAPIVGCVVFMAFSIESSSNFTIGTTHRFLCTWLNAEFALSPIVTATTERMPLALDASSVNVLSADLDAMGSMTVPLPGNLGARTHDATAASLPAAILGLRSTAPADLPWVFSPYCYLDFKRTRVMAVSVRRQVRCTAFANNGAVYLESALRNTDWGDWVATWSEAFTIAFGAELAQSNAGRAWLASVMEAAAAWLPVADEAAYWQRYGICVYQLQWQNFKSVGLLNGYSVVNAFGSAYDLTLVSLNGSYRIPSQTSYKMYWGLANDLAAVTRNGSGVEGRSLLRSSANYAYGNTSLQSVLLQNGTLNAPLGPGLTLVSNVIGPFGAIDLHVVAVPGILQRTVHELVAQLRSVLAANASAVDAYRDITTDLAVWPAPRAWIDADFLTYGGSLLCDTILPMSAVGVAAGILALFSFDYGCDTAAYYGHLQLNREALVLSSLLAGVDSDSNVTDICAHDPFDVNSCTTFVPSITAFTKTYGLSSVGFAVRAAVAALDIRLLQYGTENASAPLSLFTAPVLADDDPGYALYAWALLLEWARGDRDVVRYEGDAQALTLLSEKTTPVTQDLYAAELPTRLAQYAMAANTYVTGVMLLVASLVGLYIVVARGHIERRNALKLNRVGAMCWVGRPLVFIRSVSAMVLLSTATLELHTAGGLAFLRPAQSPWYDVVLAASEVTWLVEVLNDVAMVVTRETAARYATTNSFLVWGATALLTLVHPVTYTAAYAPTCSVVQMNFQVVCRTATVDVGSSLRLGTLLALTLAGNVGCYATARLGLRWPSRAANDVVPFARPPRPPVRSLLLSAGATFLYHHDAWVHGSTYYLDRASAVLNGIVSVSYRGVFYVLDIKLWRVFVLEHGDCAAPDATAFALPLPLN
ncbi:hypothetical protein ACHHYP_10625 [Achlya hypogyna]|uniref:Uncharacterized protein n=1 Tax=Achlya hypogyna TaxID=1202772 RepID=A0A1V9YKW8_ACHHY|nr:hypothetical protein ACHHYP_10625 [Achlya hypogyna]